MAAMGELISHRSVDESPFQRHSGTRAIAVSASASERISERM